MNSSVKVNTCIYIIIFFLLQKWILILLNSLACNDFLLETYIHKNQRTSRSQKDHLNKTSVIHTEVIVGGLLCYGLYTNPGDLVIYGLDKPAPWRFILNGLSSSILCFNLLCSIGVLSFLGNCLCATFTRSDWPSLWQAGCTKLTFK